MTRFKQSCTYCGVASEQTVDHVPPKCFYPKPRPSDLITVPSCWKCNNDKSKDEEFFLATFMFTQAGISEAGQKLWDGKLNRAYVKNIGLKRKIAEHLRPTDVFTPRGLFLGTKIKINPDESRFENVINKIVRGLYWFEFRIPLSPEIKIITLRLNDSERIENVKNVAHQLNHGSRCWEGIFRYKYYRLDGSTTESIWLMLLWENVGFLSYTYDEQKHPKNNSMVIVRKT